MAKLFISPSTQNRNQYAGGGTEQQVMRDLRDIVVPLLASYGHEVLTASVTNDLVTGVKKANNAKCDAFVSLHSNAAGGSNTGIAQGTEVYHFPGSTKGKVLAEALYRHVAPLTPTRDRGVKTARFYELRATTMPAALIEVEFHDYQPYAQWIRANLQPIAEAIVAGIVEVYGGKRVESTSPTPAPATPAPPPAPKPQPSPTYLKNGVRGAQVKCMQAWLNKIFPSYSKLQADGIFGPATERVVKEFQRRVGLQRDGIVGPATRKAMEKYGIKFDRMP